MTGGRGRVLEVEEEHEGLRLDNFLTALLPDHSRSQIQRLIKEDRVKAPTGKAGTLRASTAVHAGQTFEVDIPAPTAATPEPEALPLRIVFQDQDVVVHAGGFALQRERDHLERFGLRLDG